MQSLPSSLYSWLPALIAAFCMVGLLATCKETVRWESSSVDRSLWARDQSYCRRDAERRSGRERERELGRSETVGGGSYQRGIVSYDAARYVARPFEECLRAHGYTKVEQTER